jgi:hypothetical protein
VRGPTAGAVAFAGLAVVVAVLGYRLGAGDPAGALAAAVGGCPAALLLALGLRARSAASGSPAVRSVDPLPGTDADELVRFAAALHRGTGPVGDALVRAAGAPLPGVSDLDGTAEGGLRGVVSELHERAGGRVVVAHAVLAGPAGWLAAHGVAEPAAAPGTVLVAWDGSARGVVAVGTPRPRTPPALRAAVAVGAAGAAVGAVLAPSLPVPGAVPVLGVLAVALLGCLPQPPDGGYRRVGWLFRPRSGPHDQEGPP